MTGKKSATQSASLRHERQYYALGCDKIFGLDEVGRGPWAGPVAAGAVCLPLSEKRISTILSGVRDSKQLTPRQRVQLAERIKDAAAAWGVGSASSQEIDEHGIDRATRMAMGRALDMALQGRDFQPDCLFLDSLLWPEMRHIPQVSIVGGDQRSLSIAAASIIAKVWRDDLMRELDKQYPQYEFGLHKGYGTAKHRAILAAFGMAYDFGGSVLKGELSADLLVGSGAPPAAESPLRAALGFAQDLGKALVFDVTVEGVFSSRPDFGPGDPLIPIEPRVTGLIGLRYRLEPPPRAAPPPAPAEPTAPAPPPKPTTVPLELHLIDDDGQEVADATVELEVDGKKYPLTNAGNGDYRIEQAPIGSGRGKLRASGESINPIEKDVQLGGGAPVKVEAQAPVALPTAQVRGLVRSFQGKPLMAKIRVEPSGQEVGTDDKGSFVVDVDPGEYQVTIEAEGYETQRRTVKVGKQGVVVLNADLVKGK